MLLLLNAAVSCGDAGRDGYVEHLKSALSPAERLTGSLGAYSRAQVLYYWSREFDFAGLDGAMPRFEKAVEALREAGATGLLASQSEQLLVKARAELQRRR